MYNLLGNKNQEAKKQESKKKLLRNFLLFLCFFVSLFLYSHSVHAFNEFQTFIEEKSKKQLNCAYCHAHPNGPEGNDEGQLDSLSENKKKLTAYNQYLSANKLFINSPILNDFGNYLVKKLGYEELVNAQNNPSIIIERLKDLDFDKDGINDSTEIQEGTLPSDPLDGNPYRLFINNLKKNLLEILLQIFSVVLFTFSLFKLKKIL